MQPVVTQRPRVPLPKQKAFGRAFTFLAGRTGPEGGLVLARASVQSVTQLALPTPGTPRAQFSRCPSPGIGVGLSLLFAGSLLQICHPGHESLGNP